MKNINIILITENEILKKQIDKTLREVYCEKNYIIRIFIFDNVSNGLLHNFRQKQNHIAIVDIKNSDDLEFAYKIKLITNKIYMIYHTVSLELKDFSNVESYRTTYTIEDTIKATLFAIKRIQKNEYSKFHFQKNGVNIEISFDDILYLYSDRRTVRFKCLDGKEEYFYEKLNDVEDRIGTQGLFVRVSNTHMVNMKYVIGREGRLLQICDGTQIKVTKKDIVGKFWEV